MIKPNSEKCNIISRPGLQRQTR